MDDCARLTLEQMQIMGIRRPTKPLESKMVTNITTDALPRPTKLENLPERWSTDGNGKVRLL